jgi:plasmid stabilization system protein ParE
MKGYAVIFEESAQTDVRSSYEWGCRLWGKRQAQRWVRELRAAVLKQLRAAPKALQRKTPHSLFRIRVVCLVRRGMVRASDTAYNPCDA